ncbi:unnamed protein product [Didymodactylos carnosus]|nr:unnamed protein product [Didymodactylos carnosus]CAF4343994.1 unnamed protein product [Didymodactylos carnosus]
MFSSNSKYSCSFVINKIFLKRIEKTVTSLILNKTMAELATDEIQTGILALVSNLTKCKQLMRNIDDELAFNLIAYGEKFIYKLNITNKPTYKDKLYESMKHVLWPIFSDANSTVLNLFVKYITSATWIRFINETFDTVFATLWSLMVEDLYSQGSGNGGRGSEKPPEYWGNVLCAITLCGLQVILVFLLNQYCITHSINSDALQLDLQNTVILFASYINYQTENNNELAIKTNV